MPLPGCFAPHLPRLTPSKYQQKQYIKANPEWHSPCYPKSSRSQSDVRRVGKRGLRRMEMVGRIMDSIAEAPQSRRAKPSVSPAGDMGASSGLSFVDTMIGLVQPPSPQEPAKAAPESSEVGISLKLAPEPLLKDGTSLTDTSSITSLAVPALPLASTPINLIPKTPADAAIQEGTGATGLANAAQNVAITLGLTGDTFVKELVLAPGDISGAEPVAANPDIKSGEALPVTTQTADVLATTSNDTSTPAQALALKTQAAASQSLMAGLSASGQTQQPAPKDSQVAQLAASAFLNSGICRRLGNQVDRRARQGKCRHG
jgi:hypothetical protein